MSRQQAKQLKVYSDLLLNGILSPTPGIKKGIFRGSGFLIEGVLNIRLPGSLLNGGMPTILKPDESE